MMKRMEQESALGSQFSVSQRESKMTDALLETTKDIKIERFSISARGKDLLVNAALQITAGRRYGLVGPNGLVCSYQIFLLHFSLSNLPSSTPPSSFTCTYISLFFAFFL